MDLRAKNGGILRYIECDWRMSSSVYARKMESSVWNHESDSQIVGYLVRNFVGLAIVTIGFACNMPRPFHGVLSLAKATVHKTLQLSVQYNMFHDVHSRSPAMKMHTL